MFLCLSFTEQCFLRIRKFLTGWYTGSRCCCSTKTTLQNRSNLYQTVDMLPVICFSHLFLFQLAVCFERQYIFKQFIFLCIAYMVYFNLSCMAHTLGKFTLVRSSYCVFTLFFACVRYQKKKKWDGIYPPPPFFFIQKMKKIILSNNDWDSDIQSPSQMCSWQGSRILYMAAINSFLSPRNRDDQCMVSEDTWYQQPWLTYFFVKRQKNR